MSYRVVSRVVGLLLLVAAGLKLYGFRVALFAGHGWWTIPWVQLAAVEWEIILGVWLLWGRHAVGAWLAALATFLTFAGVSGYLGWVGQATCGCFGAIEASPWHAFALDIAVILALAFARPNLRALPQHPRRALRAPASVAIASLAGAAGLFAMLAGIGTWAFGSFDAALAYLRGERISVRPGFIDLGSGAPGQTMEASVELVNRTDKLVRIVGGTSDCSCVTTADLPIALPPGEARRVSIRIVLPATPGLFNRKAFFWTDDDRARTIVFPLTGKTEPPASVSAAASGW